ncbi:putative ribonuclease H domain, reverse transcriptase zinc-binding domain-containing protein [Arabidopsis thaliana]
MHFAWQCISGCLATCQRLTYRHMGTDKGCPRCGETEETINHLLFHCPPSRQALSPIPTSGNIFPRNSLFYNFVFLFWRGREFEIGEESPLTRLSESQLDASWHADDSLSGHGWVLVRQDSILHLGLKSARRSLSPLHAKFDSLLWAMECMISIGDTSSTFASDCSDLISILNNQDDWPTFVAELASYRSLVCFFPSFNIRFLPRSSNTRADSLAKKAWA